MNLYNNINSWILLYPKLNNWIYFNAVPVISGTVSMNPVSGEKVVRSFIDGSKECELIFAIDMVCDYDNIGTTNINMKALDEVQNFTAWIEQKGKQKDFPDLGEYNKVQKIEVLTNVPSILVDTQQSLAKYQFQTRIIYKDESEVI